MMKLATDMPMSRREAVLGIAAAGTMALPKPAMAAAAAFGRGPRSGLGWHSGCSIGKYADFAAYRGRPLDTITCWCPLTNWSEVVSLKAGFSTAKSSGARISTAIAPLPSTHDGKKNPGNWKLAAGGSFDGYYEQYARNLAASGRTNVVVRVGWESNDPHYPYFAGTDPARFKATFARIAGILRKHNPTVLIEWSNVRDGRQTGSVETLYPGDQWVDIVGVNYYDGYPAMNSEAIWAAEYMATRLGGPKGIGAWLKFARDRRKKFAVSEWGVWRGRPGTIDNPFYIRKMYEFFQQCGADLAYENYFNQIEKHQLYPNNINPRASAEYKRLWQL